MYLEEHDAERKSVGSFWKNFGHESVKDHYIKNYVKNIRNKFGNSVQVPYEKREEYVS